MAKNPNIPKRDSEAAAAVIYGARFLHSDYDLIDMFGNLVSDHYKERIEDVDFFADELSVGIAFKDVPYVLWQPNNTESSWIYLMYKHVLIQEDDEESRPILDIQSQEKRFKRWLDYHIPGLECQKYLLFLHPR